MMRAYENAQRNLYQRIFDGTRHKNAIPVTDVPKRYTGGHRALYERAIDFLEKHKDFESVGVPQVKPGERCAPDGEPKAGRPRTIIMQCCRNPENGEWLPAPIAAELPGRLLVEEGLHTLRNPNGTRQCASGRTLHQRAHDIKDMFPPGGCCLSIDATSFDGSLGHLARLEREGFLTFAQRHRIWSRHLELAVGQQNDLKLRNRDGFRGRLVMNRASGTAGTSAGNKCVMLAALMAACGPAYTNGDVFFYCDGDDTLLFLSAKLTREFDLPDNEKGPTPAVRSWMRRMGAMGLEIKIDGIAHAFQHVVFCRAKPCMSAHGWMMVKDPASAFQNLSCVIRHFRSPQLPTYLSTLRSGFGHMWDGVPVLGCIGHMYPDNGKFNRSLLATNGNERWLGKRFLNDRSIATEPNRITAEARHIFTDVYGLSVTTQLRLEAIFQEIGESVAIALETFKAPPSSQARITVT
jgi:hypothetical protein